MTCLVYPDDRIVVVGDSITDDYSDLNAWYRNSLMGLAHGGGVHGMGRRGGLKRTNPTWINSGVGGNTTASVISDGTDTRITDHDPDIVIIELGVNDAFTEVADATFESNYQAIVDDILAWNSDTRIICMSILCYGEAWDTGPVWADTAINTDIAEKNTIISDICTADGLTYVDTRANLLTWEVANNAAKANTGAFCYDETNGVHPNATGRELLGQWVAEQMRFVR